MKKVIAMMLCVCMLVCGLAGTVQAAAYSDWKDLLDNSGNWMYYEEGIVLNELRGYTSVNASNGYVVEVDVTAWVDGASNFYDEAVACSSTSRYVEASIVENDLALIVDVAVFAHEVRNATDDKGVAYHRTEKRADLERLKQEHSQG